MAKVLLTGISGFVGQHCAVELLKKGYAVRGSVRQLAVEKEVRQGISKEVEEQKLLEFCQLNLLSDEGWDKAMEGCDYLLHVASPFVIAEPKDEDEMIKPAVEGTLRALKAAKRAGVKKVVLTSSTVAMAGDQKKVYLNQESWTNEKTDRVSIYMKSKTLAEKAAWDFYNDQNNVNKMELTVINPGPIYGPTLTGNLTGASMSLVRDIISGKMPMLPNTNYIMSDVRDVAKIHAEALENTKSNGGRFIVASEKPHSFIEIASILKNNGYHKASPKRAPSVLIKIMSLFSKEMKGMVPFLDTEVGADITVTKDIFDWCPIPFDKTVIETAQSIKPF